MANERFESVWDAICDTAEDTETMKLWSSRLSAVQRYITDRRMTAKEAGALFGIETETVERIRRGRVGALSTEDVEGMIRSAAGQGVRLP